MKPALAAIRPAPLARLKKYCEMMAADDLTPFPRTEPAVAAMLRAAFWAAWSLKEAEFVEGPAAWGDQSAKWHTAGFKETGVAIDLSTESRIVQQAVAEYLFPAEECRHAPATLTPEWHPSHREIL
jgi:hypothetical protein